MSAGASARPRLLLISLDPVGAEMRGLGIRYLELARALRNHADVTLAAPGSAAARPEDAITLIDFRPHDPSALRAPIAGADAVFTHPQWPVIARWMARSRARLIYDLYDPETLETIELFSSRPPAARRLLVSFTLDRLNDALSVGDHFVCASERQRDLWLGALLARRLIDPVRYDRDPTFRSVIDVVPFGIPSSPPAHDPSLPSLRERFPQIGASDEIVLWNGGLWRWLDAPTAIRGVAALVERRPNVRLVFMGGAASVPAAREASQEAHDLARALGLLGSVVFFNEDWVPYEQRANWLLDADVAISTHGDHLETRFAFRTRLLDCLWAELPVVCTEGDDLAERVERDGLGRTVPTGSPQAVASALDGVLNRGRDTYAEALRSAAAELAWPRVVDPILRFIADPVPPADAGRRRLPRSTGQRLRAAAYLAGRRALDRARIGSAPGQ